MIEIKFLVRIRGAFTPAPKMDAPVRYMPTDAPMTESEMVKPTPTAHHTNGLNSVKVRWQIQA